MFDTREFLLSLAAPEFIAADGTRFRGRVLSLPQWQAFEGRMQAARNQQLDWRALQALILDLCDAFFPRGRRFWTRRFWRPVRWHVSRLPPVGQMRAMWDFMQSQGQAAGMEVTPPPGTSPLRPDLNAAASSVPS